MPMTSLVPLDQLVTRFQQQTPIRASSLIITLYGDAIEPHGGTVWLGSLIQLLEPMGTSSSVHARIRACSVHARIRACHRDYQ